VAGYVDLEADLTTRFLVALAGRYENYSDFGSTTNGKVSSRFTMAPGYVLRGAASTGFRAPSLQQSYYSATATNFVNVGGNLQPFEIKTFPVNTPQARVLGATALEPEKSVNLSLGVALEPVRSLSLTVDAYQIDIDDRSCSPRTSPGRPWRRCCSRSARPAAATSPTRSTPARAAWTWSRTTA
jgi:iron complex outermembrane receptor protein